MNKKNKGTILIIEDEEKFRRIYRDVLENDGYKVLESGDGEGGLKLAKLKRPDLILLDLVLPKLHGFEVLKNIRSDKNIKDIPVIIFSVLGSKEDIRKGLEFGANDYTVKGFHSPREILNKVSSLLMTVDIKKNINSYSLLIKGGRADAAKLQQNIGLVNGFQCPHCKTEIGLEVTPDHTRVGGHWFSARFVCPECGRSF